MESLAYSVKKVDIFNKGIMNQKVDFLGCGLKKMDSQKNQIFRETIDEHSYEKVTYSSYVTQKTKPIQIITKEEKDMMLNTSQEEISNMQYNVNNEYFEPFQNSPPNTFLLKLYKRYEIHTEQQGFIQ